MCVPLHFYLCFALENVNIYPFFILSAFATRPSVLFEGDIILCPTRRGSHFGADGDRAQSPLASRDPPGERASHLSWGEVKRQIKRACRLFSLFHFSILNRGFEEPFDVGPRGLQIWGGGWGAVGTGRGQRQSGSWTGRSKPHYGVTESRQPPAILPPLDLSLYSSRLFNIFISFAEETSLWNRLFEGSFFRP